MHIFKKITFTNEVKQIYFQKVRNLTTTNKEYT